ncbi:hypothetical protein HYH02_000577 [Chlamydomonas schloesseri]|uniref:Uncharacterized protein n=1 Tax=Chlamydomonas schloesseri TaxID=2026947 RepID=A0A835WY64_9CHLO|nr:hypothetical protein HYH02_000577 [Chlamydomonas schloesseri]|eukprot:KAG2454741.1 hypothetical protein HYH02_000577 [Chlamydomonas schloesseri]
MARLLARCERVDVERLPYVCRRTAAATTAAADDSNEEAVLEAVLEAVRLLGLPRVLQLQQGEVPCRGAAYCGSGGGSGGGTATFRLASDEQWGAGGSTGSGLQEQLPVLLDTASPGQVLQAAEERLRAEAVLAELWAQSELCAAAASVTESGSGAGSSGSRGSSSRRAGVSSSRGSSSSSSSSSSRVSEAVLARLQRLLLLDRDVRRLWDHAACPGPPRSDDSDVYEDSDWEVTEGEDSLGDEVEASGSEPDGCDDDQAASGGAGEQSGDDEVWEEDDTVMTIRRGWSRGSSDMC